MTKTKTTTMLALAAAMVAPASAEAGVKIVASTGDLAAIAREVAGDGAEVVALAPATVDPHYVDPRPSLVVPMSRADLLIANGLDLEIGWLPKLVEAARNPHIQPGQRGYLDASTTIDRLEVPSQRIDRAMGDVHPGGNPHFTVDPRAARRVAAAIRDRLVQIDRDGEARYTKNFDTFAAALDRVQEREHERFSHLPPANRQIVVYHASLAYLRDWLHLERVATIEPQPGIPPSPAHVAKVLKAMRATNTKTILQESFYPQRTSETLAKLAPAKLVVFDGITRFEQGERYIEHIQHITEALYAAMAN